MIQVTLSISLTNWIKLEFNQFPNIWEFKKPMDQIVNQKGNNKLFEPNGIENTNISKAME